MIGNTDLFDISEGKLCDRWCMIVSTAMGARNTDYREGFQGGVVRL
jgi:hypothetical protein